MNHNMRQVDVNNQLDTIIAARSAFCKIGGTTAGECIECGGEFVRARTCRDLVGRLLQADLLLVRVRASAPGWESQKQK
jgi:hypothetical protein